MRFPYAFYFFQRNFGCVLRHERYGPHPHLHYCKPATNSCSASRVGPAAAASPTIASLLWFLAALATMWCVRYFSVHLKHAKRCSHNRTHADSTGNCLTCMRCESVWSKMQIQVLDFDRQAAYSPAKAAKAQQEVAFGRGASTSTSAISSSVYVIATASVCNRLSVMFC